MASNNADGVDGCKQGQCAYDHFWRCSVQIRLKENRYCGRMSHDSSSCSTSCVLMRFVNDELNSVPLRSTLTMGARVKVVCDDGIYRTAKILDQGETARRSLLYEDRTENPELLVPTWKLEVYMESGPQIQENVHTSQMRPLLDLSVTRESVHDRTSVWLDQEHTNSCTAIRRGDTVLTDDGVQRLIVVNDVELMLLYDDQCNVINYQQVTVVKKSDEINMEPCLSVFGHHMTCVLRSLTLFEATTLPETESENNELIDLNYKRTQLTSDLAGVGELFEQPLNALAAVEEKCSDATMSAEEYTDKMAAQGQVLRDFVSQKEKLTSSVQELESWMQSFKDDNEQSLDQRVKIHTDIAAAMRRMGGVCEQAKNRHEALLVQRYNFHEEVLADVNRIKQSFDAIATRMESQFRLNHDDETIQRVLDLLREIKIIASGDCNTGDQALGMVIQIREAISAIQFTNPTAASTSAESTEEPIETVTAVGATSSVVVTPAVTGSNLTIERPTDAIEEDIDVVGATEAEEGAVETEHAVIRKRRAEFGPIATNRLQKKSNVNKGHGDSELPTTTVRRPIRAIPKYKKHPTQAAIQIRRWGDKLPVEVKFERNFVFLTRSVREKAANLVGGSLPTNAKYYELLRHVTSYCKFIVNAIVATERDAVVILLPKPDDTDEETVEQMMAKQSAAIQHAVQCYQDAFKPPDTEALLQAMKHFIKIQKEQFLKGRSELEKVVKDPKMLSHLD